MCRLSLRLLLFLSLTIAPEVFGQATGQLWPEDPNAQYITYAAGTLNDETREYEIPVEAKTFRLNLWARVDGTINLEILGALGKLQPLTDPNISLSGGRDRQSIVVFDPKPGVWKLRLKGSGNFTIGATIQSELYVCCLSLLNTGSQIGNPAQQTVILKSRVQAMQVSLAGLEIQSIEFNLIDEENRIVRPVKLRQNDYSNPYLLIMLVEAPTQSFRVLARGRDQAGYAFQRIFLPLFQPPVEPPLAEQPANAMLTELAQQATAGPYEVARVTVRNLKDEPLLSASGTPIGVRLSYSLRFPRDGFYTPIPQVYPERIGYGYTGAMSLKVHQFEIAPLPDGANNSAQPPQVRYLSRAFYKAGQDYRYTIDLIPNYALYNEQKRSFCIATRTFSHNSRERFTSEVMSDTKLRFRIAIQGTDMDGRQPQLTGQTYIPNTWYSGYLKDGAPECQ
jgi:hypothetical protein